MSEDNPLYLSDAERDKLEKLSTQFNGVEALRKVLGTGERYRRYVLAEEMARSDLGDPRKTAELERREAEGDERLAAAMEEEQQTGRAFHQRLGEVSPPPEDVQK